MVLVLDAAQVEELLDIEECFPVIEQVYRDLSDELAVNRPRTHTFMPVSENEDGANFLFKSIEGGSASLGVYVLRINSELWLPPTSNIPRIRKIPAVSDGRYTEFIMMFSTENGRLLSIIPDGQVQKTRVALTHALAAKYLAREDAEVLGLFGSGWQAGAQATVLAGTRNLKRIQVYSPNREHRERFVRGMRDRVNAEIVAVVSPEKVMADADIVIGATDSLTTVIYDKWVRAGMHISGVRSWSEIDPKLIERADCVVVHNRTESIDNWCGELPSGLAVREDIGIRREELPELADIVGGKAPGRESPDDITLFVDGDAAGGPGIGIQFAAVSYVLYNKARKLGVGHELPLDWFLDREDHPYLVDEQRDKAGR